MDKVGGPDPEPAPEAEPATPAPPAGGRRLRLPAKLGWAAGAVVVAAVIAIVVVAVTGGHPAPTPPGPPSPSALHAVTNVPASVLDEVGVGGTTISSQPGRNPLALMGGTSAVGNGLAPEAERPVVFYFGALWCPFCATERWSIVVALSRFGTFTNLSAASSSPTDVYPNTKTWSFHGSTYTSRYVAFRPVEYQDERGQPLDKLGAEELKVLQRWDPAGSFPFLTVGNRFTAGLPAWLDPQLLQGLSQDQIAAALSQPHSQLGVAINANANYLTAAICTVNGQSPASVCDSAGVRAAAALLPQLPAAQPITR